MFYTQRHLLRISWHCSFYPWTFSFIVFYVFFSPMKVSDKIIIQALQDCISIHNKKCRRQVTQYKYVLTFPQLWKKLFFALSSFLCSLWSLACSLQQLKGHPSSWTAGDASTIKHFLPLPPYKQQRLIGSALLAWIYMPIDVKRHFWYLHILMQYFCGSKCISANM